MKFVTLVLVLCLGACSQSSDDGEDDGIPKSYGSFKVVAGKVIHPPIRGAGFRSLVREASRASLDTSTCTDQAVTSRRPLLMQRLDEQISRLHALGLADEIAAGRADFDLSIQDELRLGCSDDPTMNQRSLDSLERLTRLLSKWKS